MDSLKTTISFLQEALLEDPHNRELRLKLGYVFIQAHELDKARKQFQLILKEDPHNPKALTGMDLISEKELSDSDSPSSTLTSQEQLSTVNDDSTQVSIPSLQPESADFSHKSSNDPFLLEKVNVTFDDVGGMDEIKEQIRLRIVHPFKHPEVYKKYGKKIGGGILLYGPPGCGKTHIARATAGEVDAMFLSITIDDILDMWLGQSEKKIHQLFETARANKPTIVFIDEVDALGGNRQERVSGATNTIVNQLLTEMDGLSSDNNEIMIIGATNMPWAMDPAFRRPGRFDRILFVPPPDDLARAEIIKLNLKDKPIEQIDYLELAKRMQHFSGADIAHTCDTAVEYIVQDIMRGKPERPLHMQELHNALRTIKPSTTEWFRTAHNYARFADEAGIYRPLLDYVRKHRLV